MEAQELYDKIDERFDDFVKEYGERIVVVEQRTNHLTDATARIETGQARIENRLFYIAAGVVIIPILGELVGRYLIK